MKWAKGYNAEFMLAELSKVREVTGDGGYRVTSSRALDVIEPALSSAINDQRNPSHLKSEAVHLAIASKQNLSQGDFERAYRKAISDLKAKRRSYIVAAPVWAAPSIMKGKSETTDCKLDLSPDKGTQKWKRIVEVRGEQRRNYEHFFTTSFRGVEDFNLVLCRVEALNGHGAQEIAMATLSEYLGALNLIEGTGRGEITHIGFQQPIGQAIVAPQITIHLLDGEMDSDNFYFGSWSPKRIYPELHPEEATSRIVGDTRYLLRAAKRSSWAGRARLALRFYYDAVSEHDQTSAFLAGWRLLELIGGPLGVGYDVLVERAAKLFRNYTLFLQLGTHLKDQRNAITHLGQRTSTGRRSLAFQMIEFLTPLLRFHIGNQLKFRDEVELWQFCDLKPDVESRARRAYILRQANRLFDK